MAGEQIPFRDRQQYIDQFTDAARALCGGDPAEARGNLLPYDQPLRKRVIGDKGVARYWMAHEIGPDDSDDFKHNRVAAWNLDYTLETLVTVVEADGDRRKLTTSEFVAELCESLGEVPGDDAIHAFGTALTIEYEKYWFSHQERRLYEQAKKHAGALAMAVNDPEYLTLAADVPLRKANLNLLKGKLWGHVKNAYNIKATDYDPIRDMAWMTMTRRGDTHGQPYMTMSDAQDVIFGKPTAAIPQGEAK